jgi:hypothetical protein
MNRAKIRNADLTWCATGLGGVRGDRGVVGAGDGGGDGKAEAVPVAIAGAGGAKALEGPEQPGDLGLAAAASDRSAGSRLPMPPSLVARGEQCLQETLLVDAGFEEVLAGGAPPLGLRSATCSRVRSSVSGVAVRGRRWRRSGAGR